MSDYEVSVDGETARVYKTKFHGFAKTIDFWKSVFSLGGMIVTMLAIVGGFSMNYVLAQLDDRYASVSIEAAVAQNARIVKDIKKTITAVRKQGLSDSVHKKQEQLCSTTSDEARSVYAEQLKDLVEDYEEVSGRKPYIPDCEDM